MALDAGDGMSEEEADGARMEGRTCCIPGCFARNPN